VKSPTPAQRRCLEQVRDHRCSGATRLDVYIRCIRLGWVETKTKGGILKTAYSLLTPAGRAALKGGDLGR